MKKIQESLQLVLETKINISWIPSQNGITGNKNADIQKEKLQEKNKNNFF